MKSVDEKQWWTFEMEESKIFWPGDWEVVGKTGDGSIRGGNELTFEWN